MNTRTRNRPSYEEDRFTGHSYSSLDLESIGDDELEDLLFDKEEQKPEGIWNLPTVAGLSLIVVGVAYLFQELGIWSGFDLSILVGMLPWLAGILIILLGFGVLSWRPKRRKKVKKVVETAAKEKITVEAKEKKKKRLVRSRDKKIAGVCGGLAEYFSIDPTLVRIAFVIATIASGGNFLIAYPILMLIMPKPDAIVLEERITILRDS